jgi:Tol biopolymer transport system component
MNLLAVRNIMQLTQRLALLALLVGLFVPKLSAQDAKEDRFLSNIRQVTSGFVKAGEGYFSPDGRTIVYQAQPLDYPFYQIFTQPLGGTGTLPVAGGSPKRISTGRGRTTCAYFSTDGSRILFASSHLDPKLDDTEAAERRQQEEDRKANVRRRYKWDFDSHMELFEADLSGKILRRLTESPGYDAEGAYSKDGKQIAFCSDRDGDPDIYVMNSDGSEVRQLTNAPGYDGGPFISPDGKWVVFRSDRKKPDWLQLYVIGIDGKNETALTDTQGVNWGPYWHPTKQLLIWSGADHSNPSARPNYDLWLAHYQVVEGKFLLGDPIRVTTYEGADVLPVFSPDGKQLMWTSTRTSDQSSQLFLADFKLSE